MTVSKSAVKDIKIGVHSRDTEEGGDGLYCAVVFGWTGDVWVNLGIVVRDASAEEAFARAFAHAIKAGYKF